MLLSSSNENVLEYKVINYSFEVFIVTLNVH